MTIAIGFQFNDGVLFCADTKITTDVKTNESKIVSCVYGKNNACVTVFALAGSLPYARAAIEKCETAVSALDFTYTTLDHVQRAIESALMKFYRRHVWPQGEGAPTDFQLLIGLWLWGTTRILSSYNATLRTISGFECLGAGAYLARHYIRQFLPTDYGFKPSDLTLAEVRLITEYALETLMEYDESCGGEAEFMIMQNDGEIGDLMPRVWLRREVVRDLQSASWKLLRKWAVMEDRTAAEIALYDFEREVKSIGESHIGWFEHINSLKKTNQID